MTIAIYAKSNITTNDIVYVFDLQYIDHAYILSLIFFARMDFSVQYHIEDEVLVMRCDEKFISRKQPISTIMFIVIITWH